MYLEISGSGTGKTYRLVEAVRQYIAADEKNMANVIVTSKQNAEHVKQQIEKNSFSKIGEWPGGDFKAWLQSSQVRFTTPERKNAVVRGYGNVKNFFEEFDHMGFTVKKNDPFFWGNFKDDYYVTTPSKIRDLSDESIKELAKSDFLMRLLLENNGMYTSFVYRPEMAHSTFFEEMKMNLSEEEFQREIEGRFLKY